MKVIAAGKQSSGKDKAYKALPKTIKFNKPRDGFSHIKRTSCALRAGDCYVQPELTAVDQLTIADA